VNFSQGERDFAKYHMLSNQPIKFEGQVYSLSSLGLEPFHCPLILGEIYG